MKGIWALVVLGLAILWARPPFPSGDVDEIFVQFQALHEHGTFFLDAQISGLPPERQLLGPNGHYYSKYGMIYPMAAAIWYLPWKVLGLGRALLQEHQFLIPGCLLALWVLILFGRYLIELGISRFNSFLIIWGILATHLFFYTASWPSNSVEAWMLFWATLVRLQNNGRNRLALEKSLLILAIGILVRPTLILALPWILFIHENPLSLNWVKKRGLLVMIWAVALVGVQAGINWVKTGEVAMTYGPHETFSTPLLIGLYGSLIWPLSSFLFFAPISFMLPYSSWWAFKRDPRLALVGITFVVLYALTLSKWWAWWSGPDFGQRFWLPLLPVIAILMAHAFRSRAPSRLVQIFCVILFSIGTWTQGLQYFSNPAKTYSNFMSRFPHETQNETVGTFLAHNFSTPLLKTFWETIYWRSALDSLRQQR